MTEAKSQRAKPQSEARVHKRAIAKGPNERWKVQVDVYLKDDTTNPPEFRVESALPSYPEKPGDNILVFNNNGRPGFEILFHLHDLTGKGYRFPRNRDDAVWSKIGDECPEMEPDEADRVFRPVRVFEPDGDKLIVENDNEKKRDGNPIGRFRYTLNVTTKENGTGPYLHLDPGGDDMNGPTSIS